jgi:hypothetical protein
MGRQQAQAHVAEPEQHDEPVTLEEILEDSAKSYEASAMGALRRADKVAATADARENPRVLSDFLKRLREVVSLDQETAKACIYAVPRAGKTITGPSIRFAELVAYAWRSVHCSSMPVSVDDEAVVVVGIAQDLETNRTYEVGQRRRVQRPKFWKDKEDYDRKMRDMQDLAINAAASIAIRNAILRLVPAALLQSALKAAKEAATGKGTMVQKRASALQVFAEMGADKATVLAAIGRADVADVTIEDLIGLHGFVTSINEGRITLAEAMRPKSERDAESRGRATAKAVDLDDVVGKPPQSSTPPADAERDPTDRDAP